MAHRGVAQPAHATTAEAQNVQDLGLGGLKRLLPERQGPGPRARPGAAAPQPQHVHERRLILWPGGGTGLCSPGQGALLRPVPRLVLLKEVPYALQLLPLPLRGFFRSWRWIGQGRWDVAAAGGAVEPVLVGLAPGLLVPGLVVVVVVAADSVGSLVPLLPLVSAERPHSCLLLVEGTVEDVLDAAQERSDASLHEANRTQGHVLDSDVPAHVDRAIRQHGVLVGLKVPKTNNAL
mmetsp:Transcript_10345/g.31177  ORF Transcript_10345/g.31177 Transcript_10345/m.31177 type:complete len:235 (+) Transcript_10345:405-1109(+)